MVFLIKCLYTQTMEDNNEADFFFNLVILKHQNYYNEKQQHNK